MAFLIPNDVAGGTAEQHAQASPDAGDIAILVDALAGNGVVSGCAVTQGTGMAPNVASGTVQVGGVAASVTGGTVTVTTADATNPRFDLVVVNSSGTKSVTAGTASATPVFPAIPATSVVLAAIYVGAGVTSILTADLIDKRAIIGSAVLLTADVTGILPTANGGTGIAYFTAAGPTAARVYTFPDVAGSVPLLAVANVFTANQTISSTAPSFILTDTTASAKSLTIAVDANIVDLRESAGASGSLLTLDLANARVGIGTTGPTASLHVYKSSNAQVDGIIIENPSSGTSAQTFLRLKSDATTGWLGIYSSAFTGGGSYAHLADRFVLGTETDATGIDIISQAAAGDIRFYTAGVATTNERVRIKNDGYVGIGTTGPASLLHVLGADNSTVGTFEIAATSANVTAADTFVDFRSSSGSIGTIAGTASSGVIAYNTFTGSHYTQVEEADRATLKVGMLLEATGDSLVPFTKQTRTRHVDEKRSKDEKGNDVVTPAQDIEESFQAFTPSHLVRSRISRTKGSKAAYGVWGGTDKEGRDMVLALGTGMCFVVNTGKSIEVGDYLMASDVPGAMEVQNDDVYRNLTVAKAMQVVAWQAGERQRHVACIYLGG